MYALAAERLVYTSARYEFSRLAADVLSLLKMVDKDLVVSCTHTKRYSTATETQTHLKLALELVCVSTVSGTRVHIFRCVCVCVSECVCVYMCVCVSEQPCGK